MGKGNIVETSLGKLMDALPGYDIEWVMVELIKRYIIIGMKEPDYLTYAVSLAGQLKKRKPEEFWKELEGKIEDFFRSEEEKIAERGF